MAIAEILDHEIPLIQSRKKRAVFSLFSWGQCI